MSPTQSVVRVLLLTALGLAVACGDDSTPGKPSGGDKLAPTVVAMAPANAATGVARNTNVVVTFSEAMDEASLTAAVVLHRGNATGTAVLATGTYSATAFAFTLDPQTDLEPYGEYTVTVATTAEDVAGNALATGSSAMFRAVDDTLPSAPAAPTDAGAYDDASVTFTWSAAIDTGSGVASYVLQVGTTAGGNDVFDGDVGDVTTRTVTGAQGQTLYARVAAKDVAGNQGSFSSSSDGVTVDTTAPSVPGAPTDAGACGTGLFNWSASTDSESGVTYLVEVGTSTASADVYTGNVGDVATYTATATAGQTLYARVRAVNGAGLMSDFSAWSDGVVLDTTAPSGVGTVTGPGTYTASTTLNLSWGAATGGGCPITGYVILVGTSAGGSQLASIEQAGTTYQRTAAHGDTLYFTVSAKNAAGTAGATSTLGPVTIDTSAPSVPGTPTAGADYVASSTVTFTWTAATDSDSGVTGYLVDVGTNEGASDVVSGAATATTSYVVSGVASGTSLNARVRAVNGAGTASANSPDASPVTVDLVGPTGPTSIVDGGTTSGSTSLSFSWDAATDALSGLKDYVVRVGTSAGASDLVASAIVTSPVYVYGGANGQTVYVRVTARDNVDNLGTPRDSDGITINTSAPATPLAPTAFPATYAATTVQFSWSSVATAASYTVELGTAPGSNDLGTASVGGTTYVYDTATASPSLLPGEKIYARIAAVNASAVQGAFSPSSLPVIFDDTDPSAPVAVTDRGAYDNVSVHWAWTAGADLDSGVMHELEICRVAPCGTGSAVVVTSDSTAGSMYDFTASSVADGQQLYLRVRAVNGAGLASVWVASDGLTLDKTAPQFFAWPNGTMMTTPVPGAVDLELYFSEPMVVSSVEAGFTLKDGANAEPQHGYDFAWSADASRVIIAPDTQDPAGILNDDVLTPGGAYLIGLTNAEDRAGNVATHSGPLTAFAVMGVGPTTSIDSIMTSATNVRTSSVPATEVDALSTITVTFAQDMNTIASGQIGIEGARGGGAGAQIGSTTNYNMTLAWTNARTLVATFDAGFNLAPGTYRLYVAASFASGSGWASEETTLQVRGPTTDVDAPAVVSGVPRAGATGVDRLRPFVYTLTEDVRKETLAGLSVTGGGLSIADFDRVIDEHDGNWMLILAPRKALPASTQLTVSLAATLLDLAGNAMTPTDIQFTTAATTDTTAPALGESWPTPLSLTSAWSQQLTFTNGASFDPDPLDASSLTAQSVLVTDASTGRVLRGHEVARGEQSNMLRYWPTMGVPSRLDVVSVTGNGGAGEVTVETASPHLLVDGDIASLHGLPFCSLPGALEFDSLAVDVLTATTYKVVRANGGETASCGYAYSSYMLRGVAVGSLKDAHGNAASAGAVGYTLVGGGPVAQNQWPLAQSPSQIRVAGATGPNVRALTIQVDAQDPDSSSITATVSDRYTGGVSLTGPVTYQLGDGPPDAAVTGMGVTEYGTKGFHTYDIDLDDGEGAITSVTRRIYSWTSAETPSLVAVGGVTPSASAPVLITDTTPELTWSDVDTAVADLAQVIVVDTSIFAMDGGDGARNLGMFAAVTDPALTTLTVPSASRLDVGLHLWAVVQAKMPRGQFGDSMGEAWSFDVPQLAGSSEPFFVVGPSNAALHAGAPTYSMAQVMLPGMFGGTWDATMRVGTFATTSSIAAGFTGVDETGATANFAGNYGYDATSGAFAYTYDMSNQRGWMGRGTNLFATAGVTSGGGGPQHVFSVGAKRPAKSDWLATDLVGNWNAVVLFVDDTGSTVTDTVSGYGRAVAEYDVGLGAFEFNIDMFVKDVGGGLPVPHTTTYTVTPAGEVAVADVIPTPSTLAARGWIGGGVGSEIIPLVTVNTGSDEMAILVLVRAHDMSTADEADVSGAYAFSQLYFVPDREEAFAMSGTAVFNGSTTTPSVAVHFEGAMGVGDMVLPYDVDATNERLAIDNTVFFAGPDGDTFIGVVDPEDTATRSLEDFSILVLSK